MAIRSNLLGAVVAGASVFAFASGAVAQTAQPSTPIPAECLDAQGNFQLTDMNTASCSQYDSTSSVLPSGDLIHNDTPSTSNTSPDEQSGPEVAQ